MLTRFSSKPTIRFLLAVLAGPVAVMVILGGLWLGIWAWEHSRISNLHSIGLPGTDPPRINITRSDYERALARWQAQKVEEYEITTYTKAFMGGTVTMHVRENGNKVDQLAPKVRLFDTLTKESIDYLKEDTIEGLFETLSTILANDDVFKSPAMSGSGSFYMAYDVTFHPYPGYPKHIVAQPITGPGAHVYDADWDLTVTDLKIIKQGK